MQDYVRPDSLSDATALLAAAPFQLLAGGTDLYPGAGSRLSGPVMDLTAVGELHGITFADDIRIGAATPWSVIAAAELPPAFKALQEASLQVGGRQIQNAGTVGGNLCNASPAADGVPPLLILDAEVELASAAGFRRMKLADFLIGPRQTALRPGELLSAVIIPEAALQGGSRFLKLGARRHLVISIAMVAARVTLDQGRIATAAIAVGACSAIAQRLSAVERALIGAAPVEIVERINPTDIAAVLSPLDDVRASASYRLAAARELVVRAVTEAA